MMLEDILVMIRQWRMYRAWEYGQPEHYARLTANYAFIIRERIRRYAQPA